MSQERLEQINREIDEIEMLLSQERIEPSAEQVQIERYEAAANAAMEYDPKQAMQWYSKADKLRESSAGSVGKIPADARMLIQQIEKKKGSLANSNMFANASDADKARFRTRLETEIAPLYAELESIHGGRYAKYTSPLQTLGKSPAPAVTPLGATSDAPADATGDTLENVTDRTSANVALDSIELPKYNSGKDATAYLQQIREQVSRNSSLSQTDRNAIVENAAAKVKAQPSIPATDAQIVSKIYKADKDLFKPMKPNATKFKAGKAYLKSKSYLAAIAAFTKVVMGEAVNEADILNQLKKGEIDPSIGQMLKNIIGFDADLRNYQEASVAAENAAREAIQGDLVSLDNAGLTPKQKTLFTAKYLGVADMGELLKPTIIDEKKKSTNTGLGGTKKDKVTPQSIMAGPKPQRSAYAKISDWRRAVQAWKKKGGE
jgi:hypothetical protein